MSKSLRAVAALSDAFGPKKRMLTTYRKMLNWIRWAQKTATRKGLIVHISGCHYNNNNLIVEQKALGGRFLVRSVACDGCTVGKDIISMNTPPRSTKIQSVPRTAVCALLADSWMVYPKSVGLPTLPAVIKVHLPKNKVNTKARMNNALRGAVERLYIPTTGEVVPVPVARPRTAGGRARIGGAPRGERGRLVTILDDPV